MRPPVTLLIVLSVVVIVWALVEIVQSDPARVRRMPRWAWAVLAVLSPLGAVAWFFFGRPKVAVNTPGQTQARGAGLNLGRRQRYVARPAPDDDPEFLRKLNDEAEHQRMLRRLEDDLQTPGKPPKPAGEPGSDKDSDPRPRD